MAQMLWKATQEECLCTIYNIGTIFQSAKEFIRTLLYDTVMLSSFKAGPVTSLTLLLDNKVSQNLPHVSFCPYKAFFFHATNATTDVLKGVCYGIHLSIKMWKKRDLFNTIIWQH